MDQKANIYVPYVFRFFQGFSVVDIKESFSDRHLRIILEANPDRVHLCDRCGHELGAQDGRYYVEARHLKVCNWTVSVCFWREKRDCPHCKKVRSELIEFLCPTSPHMTLDMAWWINELSGITSVLQVSKLERIDKMACYKVDKYILLRLLQNYKIPKVTKIGVDEVYARSKKQLKEGENRDDLFFTVITDLKTRKVIWASEGRDQEALDEFFEIIGEEACKEIQVVSTDQHEPYSASVKKHCPNAKVVWDRFHLVQKFNEVLNEERKDELQRIDPEGAMGDLMNGKYRYVFLTKAENRNKTDQRHIDEVMRLNTRMAKLEIIKEHFHKVFDCATTREALTILEDCCEWAFQAKAFHITSWIFATVTDKRFWNYFICRVTNGLSEGINRAIKGLKWQAYGYKDMLYFRLKIMQKCGYLKYSIVFH